MVPSGTQMNADKRGSGPASPAHSLTGSPAHPWHTPIRIETRDTCGVDPYSVLLEVDGQTYDADNRGFDFEPTTGLISFLPAKASPRPILFADAQRVKVRLLKATDHLGRPYVVDEESRASVPLAKAAIRPGEIALHSAAPNPKSQIQSAVRRTKSSGTLETEYAVNSPLKLTPANPDGKNGWYVTMPTFSLEIPQAQEGTKQPDANGSNVQRSTSNPPVADQRPTPSTPTRPDTHPPTPSVDWLRAKTGDPHAQRGNMVNTLIVRGKLPGQAAPVYGKLVKVDTTVPKTTAKVERESVKALERESAAESRASVPLAATGTVAPPSEGRKPQTENPKPVTVVLAHDDYALQPGGLLGAYFKNPDFTEPLRERQDGPINFNTTDYPATPGVSGANSARWTGFLYADKTQEYDLEIVISQDQAVAASLWVNDELVLDPKKKSAPWSLKQKVLLTQGHHKVRLEVTFEKPAPWWLQLYWWRADRDWRELIPAENLLAERSLAKTFYRWDDGKPQEYKGPLTAPPGKHILYFHSEDEAGHVEAERKREIEG